MPQSKTMIIYPYNGTGKAQVYLGEFTPDTFIGMAVPKWLGGKTAHQGLAAQAGFPIEKCIAGSLNPQKDRNGSFTGKWIMGTNSSSVNEANGYGRHAHGNRFVKAKEALEQGDYKRIS